MATIRSHEGGRVTATKTVAELRVTPAETARLQQAGAVVLDCRRALAGCRDGILAAVTANAKAFADWQHYPPGEVYDPQSHAQYFYHAHPLAQRSAREHGHFHTFLRAEGMPMGVAPLVLPETALADALPTPPQAAPIKHGTRTEISHLIAITLDARGEPIRLFTTNRWVTGETWYRADDVVRMLDCFTLGAGDGPALLNCWVGAIVALFRPQVAALLQLRDDTVMSWRRRRRANIFEDTRVEVTSSFEIDLDAQLAFVDRLRPQSSPDFPAGSARLPPMAEGWGEDRAD
jgi:hypothetical protein